MVLRMVVMFFMTPFMVSHLGMAGFGTWVVLTTAISFLDLCDGGVTLSGTRFLARAIGSKDSSKYEETAATLAWLYHRIGLLSLAGTAALVLAASWFVKDGTVLTEARQALGVLGISLALRFFLRIHLVVLKSHVRYDLIVISGLVKLVIQSGLIVVMLLNGCGLLMLAVAQIASDVVDQILVVIFSRRTHAPMQSSEPCKPLIKEVLSHSATMFLNTLGQFLRSRLDTLVLSLTTGVATVPIYSTGTRLLTLFGDLMNAIIGGPVLAGFCQVEGSSGHGGLREKFRQSMRFSVPLVTLGAVGLFAYGPSFLSRWLGPAFDQSGVILRMLVVPFALRLMQLPTTSVLLALNRHQEVMKSTLAAGVVNLVVSLVLAWKIGFFGVVLGSVIEMTLFYGFLVPFLAVRALGFSLLLYYDSVIIRPVLGMALPLAGYVLLTARWLQADYLRLTVLALGMTVVAGVIFWIFDLTRDERVALMRRLRRRS